MRKMVWKVTLAMGVALWLAVVAGCCPCRNASLAPQGEANAAQSVPASPLP